MIQIIFTGIISSVAAALIISGFKFLSKTLTGHIKRLEEDLKTLELKIDYMEMKHEALVMALHDNFHNGFYCTYKKELERLTKDYEFVNQSGR